MAKDIYNNAGSASARTAPPTLEEAEEFARAENIRTNVRKFHGYYSARSWIFPDGEPVRDWRALLRTWAERDKDEEKPSPQPKKIPELEECPGCHSHDLKLTLDRAICKKCGKFWDYKAGTWSEA